MLVHSDCSFNTISEIVPRGLGKQPSKEVLFALAGWCGKQPSKEQSSPDVGVQFVDIRGMIDRDVPKVSRHLAAKPIWIERHGLVDT